HSRVRLWETRVPRLLRREGQQTKMSLATHARCLCSLSAPRFSRILAKNADAAIVDLTHVSRWHDVRTIRGRGKTRGRNQIATNHRRSSLGAVVLKLPGRAQNRRVDQNDQ